MGCRLHRLLLAVVLLSPVVSSQSIEPPKVPSVAPPPPPPAAPVPVTPQRIRVGCAVQAAYTGPAPSWFNSGVNSLSDQQIADLERKLTENPGDICVRGYLIAHGGGRVSRRMNHVLWMIENYPEWDGFMLNLSGRAFGDEHYDYEHVKAAWLRKVGPSQQNGTVLHHAAVFLESREPDLAVELLERAIRLEPDTPFHAEGLGNVYALSLHRLPNSPFSARARSVLLLSDNWFVVAGALNASRPFAKGSGDFARLLEAKLNKMSSTRDMNDLPSHSDRYRTKCDFIPLLHRCEETRLP
jgi:hypothetical protein